MYNLIERRNYKLIWVSTILVVIKFTATIKEHKLCFMVPFQVVDEPLKLGHRKTTPVFVCRLYNNNPVNYTYEYRLYLFFFNSFCSASMLSLLRSFQNEYFGHFNLHLNSLHFRALATTVTIRGYRSLSNLLNLLAYQLKFLTKLSHLNPQLLLSDSPNATSLF